MKLLFVSLESLASQMLRYFFVQNLEGYSMPNVAEQTTQEPEFIDAWLYFGGFYLQNIVLQNPDYTDAQKLLVGYLAKYAGDNDGAVAPYSEIVEDLLWTETKARRIMSTLKKLGVVK
jgi:hypothetical protein